jgi:hypothetical protein
VLGEADYRGRGLDYAFTALGLHNVMLSVHEFKHAGRRAYGKAGFREVGRRRECRASRRATRCSSLLICPSPIRRPTGPHSHSLGLAVMAPSAWRSTAASVSAASSLRRSAARLASVSPTNSLSSS